MKDKLKKLISDINQLKESYVANIIRNKIREFESLRTSSPNNIFKELCFCILTANYNAKKAIKIQKAVNEQFLYLDEKSLALKLKLLGYRYPNTRAKYIVDARKHIEEIIKLINSGTNEHQIRKYLVSNVKGLGYKEASHFLRNIGFKNLAIIDFHILNLLHKYEIIDKKFKYTTSRKYLEIEETLRNIANKCSLTLAELDLYLWYLETGKILK